MPSLDILFENNEGFVEEMMLGSYLGLSGIEVVEFKLLGSTGITLDFKRINFKLLRELIGSVSCESALQGLGFQER